MVILALLSHTPTRSCSFVVLTFSSRTRAFPQTNLISAMIKYGTDAKRFSNMTKEDLEFAAEALDPELMQLFQYEMPSLS